MGYRPATKGGDMADSIIEGERTQASIITEVESSSYGHTITLANGSGFMLSAEYGITPVVGQKCTLYSHQGALIHGVELDGQLVFYRDAEQRAADAQERTERIQREAAADLERHREDYARRIAALPEPLQRKIARMRANNQDYDRDYLHYELFSLEEGIKIAQHITTITGITQPSDPAEVELRWAALDEFGKAPWELQKDVIDSGHSGNTFAVAMNIAAMVLDQDEFALEWMHGAMAGLAGCEQIGCHTDEDLAMLQAKYADSAAPAAVEGGQDE